MTCARKALAAHIALASRIALAARIAFAHAAFNQGSPPWHLSALNASGHGAGLQGHGSVVYVLDTGVAPHPDLQGRVLPGASFVHDGRDFDTTCMGHGTHCAGLVAGATYGTAPGASIVSVRVVACTGIASWEAIAQGVDWAVADDRVPNCRKVISISVGGHTTSDLADQAVQRAVRAGVVVVAAAGNVDVSACLQSPGRVPVAITVASVDSQLRAQVPGCYGPCIDLFAPGVAITSLAAAEDGGTEVRTGTSGACPLVAGLLAILLEKYPGITPLMAWRRLAERAVKGVVQGDLQGSPNLLARAEHTTRGMKLPYVTVDCDLDWDWDWDRDRGRDRDRNRGRMPCAIQVVGQ
jgi:subtilisin family serine protease